MARPAAISSSARSPAAAWGPSSGAATPTWAATWRLKVLLDHHRDRSDLVDRFVEEAQICGQLQHPGVVPVYELGTLADRRPFFAMKLVKGRTLAALLAERRRRADDLPRFLSIFEAICQTMAYAHARGVIHRDLKPSNVMVGSFGEVQVMDWGLAKVLPKDGAEEGRRCAPGQRDGRGHGSGARATAISRRPARCWARRPTWPPSRPGARPKPIDRRADVFALGSILCEILTGAPAFAGGSAIEILRAAGRADTAAALDRLEHCGADDELLALARDCLAAVAKDRPADAGVVAGRMTAYLAGVQERLREAELSRAAESARAQEAEAKVSAERRARRLTAALAATVLLAGVLGGAGWRWVELQRLERVREASGRVNRRTPGGDPAARPGAGRGGGRPGPLGAGGRRRREGARPAGARCRAGAAQAGGGPGGRAGGRAAAGRGRRPGGRSRSDAARPAGRHPQCRGRRPGRLEHRRGLRRRLPRGGAGRGGTVRGRGGQADPGPAARGGDGPGDRGGRLGRHPARSEEEPCRRGGIVGPGRAPPTPTPGASACAAPWTCPTRPLAWRRFERLAKATPFETLGPISLDLLGRALKDAGDPAGAEAVLRRAQQRHPGDVWINYDLARSLEKLARREEAIRYYTAARSLRPETAHELAHALGDKGERDEEIAIFEDLRRLRPGSGRHLGCLGRALKNQGRSQEAAAILEAAAAANREAVRLRPDDAYAHFSLGFALFMQGKLDEAIAEYRTAIRIQPDDATFHDNLCEALGQQGKLDEAIAEHRIAIRIQPDFANAHNTLGHILSDVKQDYGAAAAEFREAIRLQPDFALFHNNLGLALQRAGEAG